MKIDPVPFRAPAATNELMIDRRLRQVTLSHRFGGNSASRFVFLAGCVGRDVEALCCSVYRIGDFRKV